MQVPVFTWRSGHKGHHDRFRPARAGRRWRDGIQTTSVAALGFGRAGFKWLAPYIRLVSAIAQPLDFEGSGVLIVF